MLASLGIVLLELLWTEVFFYFRKPLAQLGDFIGKGDTLVAQLLEAFEVIDLLLYLLGFVGRNVVIELLAFVGALQIEIGALCYGLIPLFL